MNKYCSDCINKTNCANNKRCYLAAFAHTQAQIFLEQSDKLSKETNFSEDEKPKEMVKVEGVPES